MAEPNMKSIAVVLMKPPYGSINAAEAVRHALGAVGDEIEVSLLLVDSGALAAAKGQDAGETGFTSIGATVEDCAGMGIGVYVDRASLRAAKVEESGLVEGVSVINSTEASEIMGRADRVMIF